MCSQMEVYHGWSPWKLSQTALYTWFLRRLPAEFLISDTRGSLKWAHFVRTLPIKRAALFFTWKASNTKFTEHLTYLSHWGPVKKQPQALEQYGQCGDDGLPSSSPLPLCWQGGEDVFVMKSSLSLFTQHCWAPTKCWTLWEGLEIMLPSIVAITQMWLFKLRLIKIKIQFLTHTSHISGAY